MLLLGAEHAANIGPATATEALVGGDFRSALGTAIPQRISALRAKPPLPGILLLTAGAHDDEADGNVCRRSNGCRRIVRRRSPPQRGIEDGLLLCIVEE